MFTTLIVQPIFNLLVLIYVLLPGHNFGLAIIIFTVLIRFLMWPLVKKQLHHAKAMRALQPELKKIKQAAKGDRKRESMMVMELYKERQIKPFASIGIVILQIPILLALYSGLRRIVDDPDSLINFSYPVLQNLSWMKELAADLTRFDSTLFGIVDLKRSALSNAGIYWPAMFIVIGSAVAQYYQSKQLMPTSKDARSLRAILKDASSGKQTDQSEVNAAVGRGTRFLVPGLIFIVTVNIPSALGLYWLVGGLVAFAQQSRVLKQDETELEQIADSSTKSNVIEGEIVEKQETGKRKQETKSRGQRAKKKRKKGKRR